MDTSALARSFYGTSKFAGWVMALTVFVIVWGGLVRVTGSGAGCGSDWPHCNGTMLPDVSTYQTAIEYTHRVTSGALLIMVIMLMVGTRRSYPKGHGARRWAFWSLFFTLTEAAVGAGIVLLEYVTDNASLGRAFWMAGHLVNTYLLLASLMSAWLALRGQKFSALPPGFRSRVWVGTAALLALAATGAVAALGDTVFQTESLHAGIEADFSGASPLLLRLRLFHPIVAVLGAVALYVITLTPSPEGKANVAIWVRRVLMVQVAVGILNIGLLAPAWMQLIHLSFGVALWTLWVRLVREWQHA